MKTVADRIKHLKPCAEAYFWAKDFTVPSKAWNECVRGDWMLWMIGKTVAIDPWSDERKPLLACCLDCALTVKHLWPAKHKEKIAESVETLQKWIDGIAEVSQAKEARGYLFDAATASSAAAYAAAYAADAAAAAASADAAAYAYASAAYAVVASAAYAAARAAKLKECADIVRKHYQKPPRLKRARASKL